MGCRGRKHNICILHVQPHNNNFFFKEKFLNQGNFFLPLAAWLSARPSVARKKTWFIHVLSGCGSWLPMKLWLQNWFKPVLSTVLLTLELDFRTNHSSIFILMVLINETLWKHWKWWNEKQLKIYSRFYIWFGFGWGLYLPINLHSGFSSIQRENLSPFTKDFRGEEHYNESIDYFSRPSWRVTIKSQI